MSKVTKLLNTINEFNEKYKENENKIQIELIDKLIEKLDAHYFNKPINIKFYNVELEECNKKECNKCENIGFYKHNNNYYCWNHALDLI